MIAFVKSHPRPASSSPCWLTSAPKGAWIEIGTSAGYSTLWLALACRERGQTLTTFEILAAKSEMAAQTIAAAGVNDVVTLVEGDFLAHVDTLGDIGFCFLDAEKEIYGSCYEAIVPRLMPGPCSWQTTPSVAKSTFSP